jgi:hypothetical protein
MALEDFPKGTKVRFTPGPFAATSVEATVTGTEGQFLVTKDDAGKQRKTRPGACTKI